MFSCAQHNTTQFVLNFQIEGRDPARWLKTLLRPFIRLGLPTFFDRNVNLITSLKKEKFIIKD